MTALFNQILSMRPHFFSLREIDDNVSLDIKIPNSWRYEKVKEEPGIPFAIKLQDKKTEKSLISLICPASADGYEYVFEYANDIIKINREEEEKERLFKEKVDELKSLFLNTPLVKLKEISFKDDEPDTISNSQSSREIGLGNEERPRTNEPGETKTDSGDTSPG